MKIGVIADTHDDVTKTEKAVRLFKEYGAETVIHCGDWISPFIVKKFKDLKVVGLLGNNDGDVLKISSILAENGSQLYGRFASLDEYKVCAVHGEYPEMIEALGKSGMYDAVFFGHSHEKAEKRVNGTYLLNPGTDSIVIWDTAEKKYEFLSLK
jgi:hypothetical protein